MASRKEEKERLRQQRLEAERQAQAAGRRRLVLGYVAAGILAALIVVGLIFVLAGGGDDPGTGDSTVAGGDCSQVNTSFGGEIPEGVECDDREGPAPPAVEIGDLTAAAKAAGCELRLNLKDEGATHLDPQRDKLPNYGTNPPTSGDHYPIPLADGAFLSTPSPGNYVHALEHGRIEIQYSSDLPEEDQLALKGLLDADRAGMVMFPNDDMPYDVAVTAWTQLMGCKSFEGAQTLDAIQDFRDAYRGRGPESIPY